LNSERALSNEDVLKLSDEREDPKEIEVAKDDLSLDEIEVEKGDDHRRRMTTSVSSVMEWDEEVDQAPNMNLEKAQRDLDGLTKAENAGERAAILVERDL
jgi:hypothetical protein